MSTTSDAPLRRTWAQWYCVVAGATLLIAGILGFAADADFTTGGDIDGDRLIVFEVNGWHNLVHIASGLLLLAAANYRPTAKSVAYVFGAVYGFVALWGLVDGETVFGLFPVNPADNLLHIGLSLAAIACAYFSPTTKGQQRDRRRRKRGVESRVAGGNTSGTVHTEVGSPNDGGIPSGRFERRDQDRERQRTR